MVVVIGSVGGVVFEFLTNTFGKKYSGEVWTNWYRKRLYTGILTLAYMREKLNRDNLMSTYPAGKKIGFIPEGLARPNGVTHCRTADGSWNNLDDPKEGAAGTRFPRNVANTAIEQFGAQVRDVSRGVEALATALDETNALELPLGPAGGAGAFYRRQSQKPGTTGKSSQGTAGRQYPNRAALLTFSGHHRTRRRRLYPGHRRPRLR